MTIASDQRIRRAYQEEAPESPQQSDRRYVQQLKKENRRLREMIRTAMETLQCVDAKLGLAGDFDEEYWVNTKELYPISEMLRMGLDSSK